MFDLKRQERAVLILLASALALGLCIAVYQRSHRHPYIKIGKFDLERESSAGRRKIDINTAPAEELETIKKIGKVIADRIVEYRQSHGSFASIEEIRKVKGIGQSLFDKIKDEITIGE
jgi:competence protein ComEA